MESASALLAGDEGCLIIGTSVECLFIDGLLAWCYGCGWVWLARELGVASLLSGMDSQSVGAG